MSITILGPLATGGEKLPLYSFRVPAGFPSPAADHIEKHISLDELFDIRAPHVYLVKIDGDSMQGAGIFSGEVWGVGKRMKAHFESMGIKTAMDLAKADPWMLRQKFSVVIEKTARELAGTPCLELGEADPPKQEICCSRMFGTRLTAIEPIKEAVATYTQRAAEKLRAQNSLCKKIRVSIRTVMFNPEEAKYANGALVELPYPTNDVRLMTKAATEAVNRLFRPGFKYSKAEVLLMDLRQPGEFTDDRFAHSQPAIADKVMNVLDEINGRWGKGVLRVASVPAAPGWAMRRELMSQSYTTKVNQLWTVKAR